MVEYIPCYSAPALHWGLLPATRLASREILIEQNIKKRTGPSLCVLCGLASGRPVHEHSIDSLLPVLSHPSPSVTVVYFYMFQFDIIGF